LLWFAKIISVLTLNKPKWIIYYFFRRQKNIRSAPGMQLLDIERCRNNIADDCDLRVDEGKNRTWAHHLPVTSFNDLGSNCRRLERRRSSMTFKTGTECETESSG